MSEENESSTDVDTGDAVEVVHATASEGGNGSETRQMPRRSKMKRVILPPGDVPPSVSFQLVQQEKKAEPRKTATPWEQSTQDAA